jgi:hypothetical protein
MVAARSEIIAALPTLGAQLLVLDIEIKSNVLSIY